MLEKKIPKINLQLFAGEADVTPEPEITPAVTPEPAENLEEKQKADMSMMETLKKQTELLAEQLKATEKRLKEKDEEAERKIQEERRKTMTADQLKEADEEKRKKEELQRQNELLESNKKIQDELEEMKKENKKKEFENKKLMDSQKYPWIADKISACKEESQLDFLHSITNHKTEEAKYKAERSGIGSILNINGTKSVDDTTPEDPMEIVAKRVKTKEAKVKEKLEKNGMRFDI